MPVYPGAGQAKLINANSQLFFWTNEHYTMWGGNFASVAYQLERQKAAFYPFGFAVEVLFAAPPGIYQVTVQGAEQDRDASFLQLGTMTTVNAANVARFDGALAIGYPKFVRLFLASLSNEVAMTALLTR